MADEATRRSVLGAVRLVALNERLQQRQEALLAELAESRRLLQAAIDEEREAMAANLHQSVLPRVESAMTRLSAQDAGIDDDLRAIRELCRGELAVTLELVAHIVTDHPLTGGGVSLKESLATLAAAVPVPVSLSILGDPRAGVDAERALFYVCSEALANAVKHSGAGAIQLRLDGREEDHLVLCVSDDGHGGADQAGGGLVGLRDRMSVAGGRLQVHSDIGVGTEVVGIVPRQGPRRSATSAADRDTECVDG